MGLLDDAIREHLELKRRHGADPEEVTRQEREALGAPVRGEFAKPDAAEAGAPAAREPEPEPEPEPQPGTEEDPWLVEDLADPEPPRRPEPGAVAAPEPEPAEGEDVLEETPEFLQETPEHDRLWFEQKPPRDFDWDK